MKVSSEKALKSLQVIGKFSNLVATQNSFARVVELMAEMARELAEGDRSTIWLYDTYKNEFWTKLADGVDELRMKADYGIVGEAVKKSSPIVLNDPYIHPAFNKKMDEQTGYVTKCMLTYPVFSASNNLIAVFQIVNKQEGAESQWFGQEDLDLLSIAASLGGKVLLGENYQNQNAYNQETQEIAFAKQKTAIINQLEEDEKFCVKVLYKPADVLTGDIYSIYKKNDGSILLFVIDAMGHGISPALTTYALASRVRQFISKVTSLKELAAIINEAYKNVLAEEEQISCFFFWFDASFKRVDYFGAGMYPAVLVDGGQTVFVKSNNLPFMNFTPEISVDSLELTNFQTLFIYSDGLIEDDVCGIDKKEVERMLDEDFYDHVSDRIMKNQMEDDTTLVLLEKLD